MKKERIILVGLRVVLLLSIVGKFFFPATIQSTLMNIILKNVEDDSLITIHRHSIVMIVYVIINLFEAMLIYQSFFNYKLFIKFAVLFFLMVNLFSIYMLISGINPDCGCFGDIFHFSYSSEKLIFTISLLLASIYLQRKSIQ